MQPKYLTDRLIPHEYFQGAIANWKLKIDSNTFQMIIFRASFQWKLIPNDYCQGQIDRIAKLKIENQLKMIIVRAL